MIFLMGAIDLSPYFWERTEGGMYVFNNVPLPLRSDILILLHVTRLRWGAIRNEQYFPIYSSFINYNYGNRLMFNLHGLNGFAGAYCLGFSEA